FQLAGADAFFLYIAVVADLFVEYRNSQLYPRVVKIVRQKLYALVGKLRKFAGSRQFVKRAIYLIQQVSYRNVNRASAACQGVLRSEIGTGVEQRLRPFQVQP